MSIRETISNVGQILTDSEKKRWRFSMLAVICSSLLDFFGIASLLPLLYYLLSDGDNRRGAIMFGGIAILCIIAKSIMGIWLQRYRSRYLSNLFNRLSTSLYHKNFSHGLIYIRNHGTGRIGYEITWVCHLFCQNILGTLMKMTGDIVLLTLIFSIVIVMAPLSGMILGIPLLTIVIAYRYFIGRRARHEGDRELEGRRKQTRVINDTFGGFSDIMVTGTFTHFEKEFKSSLDSIAASRLNMELYSGTVMPLCEIAVALSLALMAFSGTDEGTKMALGLFAVAAFRVIPAIRSLIWGWVQIKNASGTIEILRNAAEHHPTDSTTDSHASQSGCNIRHLQDKLALHDITFAYDKNQQPVIDHFSCTIHKGEHAGFRGESGIGKSTLFNIILGLIPPDSGDITIDGTPLSKSNRNEWLKTVGYVPQEVHVFNDSVCANIALGESNPDRDRIMDVLNDVRLSDWVDGLPDGIDTMLGERGLTLSGGERQRLGLARALYRDISVLILDEATSALDSSTESEVLATVEQARQQRNLTVLSIAHRESSLANCDRIYTLNSSSQHLECVYF